MNEWWINDKEPGEMPRNEAWIKKPGNIFGLLLLGVVLLIWATW